jgi:biopolymer transport protein ExbB/TolQ
MYKIADANFDTTRTIGVLTVAALTGIPCLLAYGYMTRNVWNNYVSIEKLKEKFNTIIGKK